MFSFNRSTSPSGSAGAGSFTFRFRPFGTSPALKTAGDFDGREVEGTSKKAVAVATPGGGKSLSKASPPLSDVEDNDERDGDDDGDMDEPMEVFVGGLRELGDSVDEQELRDHFGAFGEVLKLELTRDRRRHDQRGFCFVTFAHKSAALACLEHEEHTIRGMRIAVERAIRDTGAGKANGKKRTRRSRRPARDANLPPRAGPPPALQCPPPHVPFLGRAPISEPPSAPLQRQSSGMGMMWPFRPHVADTRYVLPSTQPATPITGPHDGDVWGFDVSADTVHAPVPPATPASGGRFLLHRFASASNVIAPSKLETMTGGYSTASNTPNPAATPSSGWRFGSRAVEQSTPVYPQPSPMFFQHDRVAPSPRHHRRHFG